MKAKDIYNNQLVSSLQNIPSSSLLQKSIYLNTYTTEEEDSYYREYSTLIEKYDRQCKSIDSNIRSILSGNIIELSDSDKNKYDINAELNDDYKDKNIEDYWYTILLNSKYFNYTPMDKQILINMTNITIEDLDENYSNFEVVFYFNPNDYFTHQKISKKYYYDEKKRTLTHAEGFDIQWINNNMNSTLDKSINIKKESFFDIFNKNNCIKSFILEDEALFFRKDLIIHQLEYYLNIKDQSIFIDNLDKLSLERTINKVDIVPKTKIKRRKKKSYK